MQRLFQWRVFFEQASPTTYGLSLEQGQGCDLKLLQATTRKSGTVRSWWLEQQVELVVRLFSASAMKASKCVPWCETTQKWYDLLTCSVPGMSIHVLLDNILCCCCKHASEHAFLLFSWLHTIECCALQNSGIYSQNVEVVKGDVYQYMTLPAAMQGWYVNPAGSLLHEYAEFAFCSLDIQYLVIWSVFRNWHCSYLTAIPCKLGSNALLAAATM